MSQIQGALVGIVLVLSAVFVPMALLGGSTGDIPAILGNDCRRHGAFFINRIIVNARIMCHAAQTSAS